MIPGMSVLETAGTSRRYQYNVNSPELSGAQYQKVKDYCIVLGSFLRLGRFDREYLAAVIGSAGLTNAVRQLGSVALRAIYRGGSGKG
jgi:hypothetical protein